MNKSPYDGVAHTYTWETCTVRSPASTTGGTLEDSATIGPGIKCGRVNRIDSKGQYITISQASVAVRPAGAAVDAFKYSHRTSAGGEV